MRAFVRALRHRTTAPTWFFVLMAVMVLANDIAVYERWIHP